MSDTPVKTIHMTNLVKGDHFWIKGERWYVSTGKHVEVPSMNARNDYKIWVVGDDGNQGWFFFDNFAECELEVPFHPGSRWGYDPKNYAIVRQDDGVQVLHWETVRANVSKDVAHELHTLFGRVVHQHNAEVADHAAQS